MPKIAVTKRLVRFVSYWEEYNVVRPTSYSQQMKIGILSSRCSLYPDTAVNIIESYCFSEPDVWGRRYLGKRRWCELRFLRPGCRLGYGESPLRCSTVRFVLCLGVAMVTRSNILHAARPLKYNRVNWVVITKYKYLQDQDKIDTAVSIVYLLCEDVRYTFRPFLGHHQASYRENKLSSWIQLSFLFFIWTTRL
jgi:hypothetical protein